MCARRGMVAQVWRGLFLGVGDSSFHGKGLVLGSCGHCFSAECSLLE